MKQIFSATLCVLSIGVIFFSLAATAGVNSWQLIQINDDIRSYKKLQAGSSLLSFKAVAIVDASQSEVMSVLLDSERAEEWIPRLMESTVQQYIE